MVGAGEPVAVAANDAVAPHWPTALFTVWLPGEVIEGGWFTVKVAVVAAVSVADVAAFTVIVLVPEGVPVDVVRVIVALAEFALETSWTGFSENEAEAPDGSPDVTVRLAVKLPELPLPLPRLTVTV